MRDDGTTPHRTPAPAMVPSGIRFGQLTYTSYKAPSVLGTPGRSGWQAKDQTPDITEVERAMLVGWVSANLDPVTAIPSFPTADDIAALPRRLSYARLDDHRAVYCHSAPAGGDPAGRPGNVFAHILFDREIGAQDASRPIERWRAPQWLTPFGQERVAAAVLGPEPPQPGEYLDRARVLRFLLARETWRIGVFRVLLDAVEHSLRGGRSIVLAVDVPDTAALWIGAVSYFMSAPTAARLNWTTFDRAGSVKWAIQRGFHIVAVPVEDTAAIEDSDHLLVVDATRAVQPGEFGRSEHHTHRDIAVPVTAWSALAETVLQDHDIAEHALLGVDLIATRMGETQLTPSWPLAMVVLGDPRLHDAKPEAELIIARESPEALKDDPALFRSVLDVLMPALGRTAQEAWNALTDPAFQGSIGDSTRGFAWETLISRALQDLEWLGREHRSYHSIMAPAIVQGPAHLVAEATNACRTLLERTTTADVHLPETTAAGTTLGMIELLVHAGLTDDKIDTLLVAAAARTLTPVLRDPERGTRFVSNVGPITDQVRTKYILPVVVPDEPDGRPLGHRFTRQVAEWLLNQSPLDLATLQPNPDPQLIRTARYHLVADAVFQHLHGFDPAVRHEWARLAPLALSRALYEEQSRDRWCPTDISPLFTGTLWSAEELLRVDSRWPNMIPARFFRQPLLDTRSETDRDILVRRILGRPKPGTSTHIPLTGTPADDALDRLAETWARLTQVEWRAVRPTDLDSWQSVIDDYARRPVPWLPPPLDIHVAIVYIVLRSKAFDAERPRSVTLGPDRAATLVSALAGNSQYGVEALLTLIDHTCLEADWICALAVLTAARAPQSGMPAPGDPLTSTRDPGGTTIFEAVAERVMCEPTKWSAPASDIVLVRVVRELLHAAGADRSPYLVEELERFIRTWRPDIGRQRHSAVARTR